MPARIAYWFSMHEHLPSVLEVGPTISARRHRRSDKRAAKKAAKEAWRKENAAAAAKAKRRSKAKSKVQTRPENEDEESGNEKAHDEKAKDRGQPSTSEQSEDGSTDTEEYFNPNYVEKHLRPKTTAGDEALARRLQIGADKAYDRNLERQSPSSPSSDSAGLQYSSTICEETPNYQGPAEKAAQKERKAAFEALVDDIYMADQESEEDAEEFSQWEGFSDNDDEAMDVKLLLPFPLKVVTPGPSANTRA